MAFSEIGKHGPTTSTSEQPVTGMLTRHILGIQAILSNAYARYPIATTVQP
ncbi:hypothetical protein [Noviherbaspirillum denitrificans]|uniref:hypothetical protein n=1 Tax=Noviherbaspirillum denitrificans TaxID=1968433 RepID=UPI0014826930|nr:hypothetical protein [Noviherbaspirillum denitrificans]